MMTTIDISQTEPNWLELLRKVKQDGISVLFIDGEQQLAELRVPKPKAYHIIETDSGPRISDSRMYVYDVLDRMNDGDTLDDISRLYNLSHGQVQTAFDYIEEHHDHLQLELAEIIVKKAERQRESQAIVDKVRQEKMSKPLSPKWEAFYARVRELERRSQHNGQSSE